MISPLTGLRALYVAAVLAAIIAASLVYVWIDTYHDMYERMKVVNRQQNNGELHDWKRPWETGFTYFMVALSAVVTVVINIPTVMNRWIYTVPAVVANSVVAGLWFFDFIFIWGHGGSGGMLDSGFFSKEYRDTFEDPDLFRITDHSKKAVSVAKALLAFTFISASVWGCAAGIMHIGRIRRWKNARFTSFNDMPSFTKTVPMKKFRGFFPSEKTSDDTIEIRIPAPRDDADLGETTYHEAKHAIYAKALYDYIAQESTEISFKAGDMVRVHKYTDDTNSWWEGEINGLVGEFPGNYVKMLSGSQRKLKAEQ